MKLTETFFHGHNHICTAEDGMMTPYRFTQERLAFYSAEREFFTSRAQNTSGISIEFSTTADMFSLDIRITNDVRNENSFTIYEDGRLTQIIGLTHDMPVGHLVYRKKNQQKLGRRCTYAIYLPVMATASVCHLSAEDAVPVPRRAKTLLALGDSITHGVCSQASAHAYPTQLARRFGLEVCNHGIGGYYFSEHAIEHECEPAIITLAYGINDINQFGDAGIILHNAEQCMKKLASVYPNVPVVCLTPLWRADFAPGQPEIYQAVTEGLLALCAQYGIHAINGCDVFPHDVTLFTDGYLHPNDDGFAIMTNVFAKEIATLL